MTFYGNNRKNYKLNFVFKVLLVFMLYIMKYIFFFVSCYCLFCGNYLKFLKFDDSLRSLFKEENQALFHKRQDSCPKLVLNELSRFPLSVRDRLIIAVAALEKLEEKKIFPSVTKEKLNKVVSFGYGIALNNEIDHDLNEVIGKTYSLSGEKLLFLKPNIRKEKEELIWWYFKHFHEKVETFMNNETIGKNE